MVAPASYVLISNPWKTTMRQIDILCYTLCLLCVMGGSGVVIMNIWGAIERDNCLKSLASLAVMATGCLLILGLNRFQRMKQDRG